MCPRQFLPVASQLCLRHCLSKALTAPALWTREISEGIRRLHCSIVLMSLFRDRRTFHRPAGCAILRGVCRGSEVPALPASEVCNQVLGRRPGRSCVFMVLMGHTCGPLSIHT